MYVFDGLDHGVGHLAYRRPSEKAATRHQCGLKCVVKAVSGALATKQRAAAKAALQAQETLQQVQEQLQLQQTRDEPAKRGPGPPPRPPSVWSRPPRECKQRAQRTSASVEQREKVAQSIHAIGHAYHFVDLERGVRCNGKLIAADIREQIDTIRSVAQHEGLSQARLERIAKAERVVPKMQATIEFVSGYVRHQVCQLDLTPPVSYAMHAHLIPSYYLDRMAQTRTVTQGESLQALAERLHTALFTPGGVLAEFSPAQQNQLKQSAQTLAEVFQRSSSNVEGRNGDLSLRNHQLRGLDRPRKRECPPAIHHFFLTRADGTTAAERFFGQKPRSMFAAILAAVGIPPAPLSPPRRALG